MTSVALNLKLIFESKINIGFKLCKNIQTEAKDQMQHNKKSFDKLRSEKN